MTVVDERPCGYCGASAGQNCRGYGLVPGDVVPCLRERQLREKNRALKRDHNARSAERDIIIRIRALGHIRTHTNNRHIIDAGTRVAMRRPGERFVIASNGPNPMTAEEHDAHEAKVLKTLLSSLDDDLHDMTDEEVKQELAEAGVDLAESERRWLVCLRAGPCAC